MNTIKFTCASRRDNGKVTVTINQLEDHPFSDSVPASLLTTQSKILVTISVGRKNFEVVFTPNRFGDGTYGIVATTAATNTWPRSLRLPKVGKPVIYEVTEVTYV